MLVCSNGHQNSASAHFCEVCGLALSAAPPAPAAPVSLIPGTTSVPAAPAAPGAYPPPGYVPVMPPGTAAMAYAPPPKKSRTGLIIGLVIGAVVLLGAGLLAFNAMKPKTTTVDVTMMLFNGSDGCTIGFGYQDVPGATLTLEADGKPVGTGYLSTYGTEDDGTCTFTGTVSAVPMNADFYSLSIGSGRRGTLTRTNAEMVLDNWDWGLTLGS